MSRPPQLPEGEYFTYLRKSRADLEAEARGEGETLAKHKKALFKLAKDYQLNVTRIYQEIASGESLLHRPEMMKLLQDAEENPPKGILVMDIDRLGRGSMQEQGLILDTLRRHNIRIITPSKTYDLNNESDEFMSEVNALFARRELKMITGRMQRGRRQSAESGNYIGTRPPYGYDIFKNDKGDRYLVPNPEQAPIVRLVFERYVNESMGANKIANELNTLGYKTYSGKKWTASSVLTIIKNEVYIGRIQWGKREQRKSKEPGKRRDTKTRPREEWIDAKGKHEPLVSEELFQKAQEILQRKYHVPYQLENGLTNPLAGVIRCDMCGASMVLRPYTTQLPHIMCYNRFCDNKSTRFQFVEEKLIQALDLYIQSYIIKHKKPKKNDSTLAVEIKQQAIDTYNREIKELEGQKLRLHDLLERGIYDDATYLDRSQNLSKRIEEVRSGIAKAEEELKAEMSRSKAQKDIIPKIKNVVKLYRKETDPAVKNKLIKLILHSATYRKEKWQRNDEFTLTLKPYIQ